MALRTAVQLTGDNLTIDDVWAVAVDRAPAALSGAAREKVARAGSSSNAPLTARTSTRTASTPALAVLSRAPFPRSSRASCSSGCSGAMPAASASRIRTKSSGRRCSCVRMRSRRGFSGARPQTVELLIECLNRGVLPHVPSRGSVGASGDLAPLAHLALPLVGEGEAWVDDRGWTARLRSRRSGSSRSSSRRKRGFRSSMGRSSWPRSAAWRWRGPDGSRRPQTSPALFLSRRCRVAHELPAPDPCDSPAARADRFGGERAQAARRLGDHRVASLVRQGSGRVLAALRAAGARRFARLARLRRGDGSRRAERGDRQPTRARRG